jgi:SAM-dependent methyltransferase
VFACPTTGSDLVRWTNAEGRRYPLLDGLPVLVAEPEVFLVRHAPDWVRSPGVPTARRVDLPVEAPDPVTPHLPQSGLGGPGGFGAWVASLGPQSPTALACKWGEELAPRGAAVDVGCGIGVATRRMVELGRDTYAFDRSPRSVLLARDLLLGGLKETAIPTHRGGYRSVRFPYRPVDERLLHLAIGDAIQPPIRAESAAWVHLGMVLDVSDDRAGEMLFHAVNLLQRGGLLTLTTAYDSQTAPVLDETPPEAQLRAVLRELKLEIAAEHDQVPWVVRDYDRGYRVYFCHCIAARVRG